MNGHTNAIITASYAPDFERCRILCESMDRHAKGYHKHYILVDEPDLDLFSQLATERRVILTDTQLLPWWLWRLPKALSPKGRRVWVSPATAPLHGWHVQQLMRIAVARLIPEDGLLYCDSDTAFVKPFDLNDMWQGEAMRLWREDGGASIAKNDHLQWEGHAARALGIAPESRADHNYVCSFVTWRRQTVLDMCDHMERAHGRSWFSVVGWSRKFSECMLYGAYVHGVLKGAGHWVDPVSYCPMRWFNPAPDRAELQAFVEGLSNHEVALGVQSFIPLAASDFRDAVLGRSAKAA